VVGRIVVPDRPLLQFLADLRPFPADRRSAARRTARRAAAVASGRVDGEAEPADFDRLDIPKLLVAESHMACPAGARG
jgi:hypothetical protein